MSDFIEVILCAAQSHFHKNQQLNFQLRNSYKRKRVRLAVLR